MAPHIITEVGYLTVAETHSGKSASLLRLLTNSDDSWRIQILLSSLKQTFDQLFSVQAWCCWAHTNLFLAMADVSFAFFTGRLAVNPVLQSSRRTVLEDTYLNTAARYLTCENSTRGSTILFAQSDQSSSGPAWKFRLHATASSIHGSLFTVVFTQV